jgi:hypothetical protein
MFSRCILTRMPYHDSKIYQVQDEMTKETQNYLDYKKQQENVREMEKQREAEINRPWYEKAGSAISTFAGELSGYYDYLRAVQGIDPETGRKLSAAERVEAGAMAASTLIPIIGWGGRIAKGGEALYKTARGLEAAGQSLKAYDQAGRTLKVLSTSEKGINALLAGNGVTEAATGRDMFGEPLTEEQRKNSLLQGIMMMNVFSRGKLVSNEEKIAAREQAKAFKDYVVKRVRQAKGKLAALEPEPALAGIPNGLFKPEVRKAEEIEKAHVMAKADHTVPVIGTVKGRLETDKPIDNIIRDGSHITEDGKLKPNVKYQTGEYDYLYETDELGRIKEFNADDLKLTKREERLPHNAHTPGKEPGDHAGHLAADRFGGSPELDNLVSQSSTVNLSQYKKIENQWAVALKKGKNVKVNVEIKYRNDKLRPSEFIIKYRIDGKSFRKRISNLE